MALLLNIDTATSHASVGFSKDGILLGIRVNDAQKEHATFLQPAIKSLAAEAGISLQQIDAVAVTIGPGSYTGLRVGLASAKGLAYALGKPLLAVGTLEVMALAAGQAWAEQTGGNATGGQAEDAGSDTAAAGETPPLNQALLFCPMIDARRDEVFTAIYYPGGAVLMEPRALILSSEVFEPYIESNILIFSGDGSLKWKNSFSHGSARFLVIQHTVAELAIIAEKHFWQGNPAPLAYVQPLYLKEFHKNS